MAITKQVLSVLKRLEDERSAHGNINWNISWETGEYLYQQITKNSLSNGLEIGGSTGFSALFLASALKKLVSIESSPKRIPIFKKNITESGLKNIILLEGHAPETLDNLKKQVFDFAFIDATKYEYLSYIKFLLNGWIGPKSFIFADNINSHKEALLDFLEFVEKSEFIESELIPIGTGLLKIHLRQ